MRQNRTRRRPGPKPDPEVRKRTKFTTKLNKTIIKALKRLASKLDKGVNDLIEEAVIKKFNIRR